MFALNYWFPPSLQLLAWKHSWVEWLDLGFRQKSERSHLPSEAHVIQTGSVCFGLEVSRASDDPPLAASKETPKWFSCHTGRLAILCGGAKFADAAYYGPRSPREPCEAQLLTDYASSFLSSWESFSFRFTCSLRTKHVQRIKPFFPSQTFLAVKDGGRTEKGEGGLPARIQL